MSRFARRFLLVLVGFAFAAPGSSPSVLAEEPLRTAAPTAAAKCCTVVYNKAETHFQVSGTVAYKGKAILFSFHAPCTSKAGPGLAYVKSRWIPLREVVAGYHHIDIVQKVNGKIVYSKSPGFFVKGTAQVQKPSVTITSGPSGVVTGTSALFKYKVANTAKVLCRLDARPWASCASLNWVQYENLAPGPHVFVLRAYALTGTAFAEAKQQLHVVRTAARLGARARRLLLPVSERGGESWLDRRDGDDGARVVHAAVPHDWVGWKRQRETGGLNPGQPDTQPPRHLEVAPIAPVLA